MQGRQFPNSDTAAKFRQAAEAAKQAARASKESAGRAYSHLEQGVGKVVAQIDSNISQTPATSSESSPVQARSRGREPQNQRHKCRMPPVEIRVCSWNMAGNVNVDDMTNWLAPRGSELADLFVIGVQEIIELGPRSALMNGNGDPERQRTFERAVEKVLLLRCGKEAREEDYKFAKMVSFGMVGLSLLVYVRKGLTSFLSELDCDRVKTGSDGRFGNKGGLCVRFKLGSVSYCFMNVHLPSGQKNTADREKDMGIILGDAFQKVSQKGVPRPEKLGFNRKSEYVPSYHHLAVVFGDLNIRLNTNTDSDVPPGPKDTWLNRYDQLLLGQVPSLRGFREGVVRFDPTYKYVKKTDMLDTKRCPAWCDRVVFKTNYNLECSLMEYMSFPNMRNTSDHKPIAAHFQILPSKTVQPGPLDHHGPSPKRTDGAIIPGRAVSDDAPNVPLPHPAKLARSVSDLNAGSSPFARSVTDLNPGPSPFASPSLGPRSISACSAVSTVSGRPKGMQDGDQVEYFCSKARNWLCATVLGFDPGTGKYVLDIEPLATAARIRRVTCSRQASVISNDMVKGDAPCAAVSDDVPKDMVKGDVPRAAVSDDVPKDAVKADAPGAAVSDNTSHACQEQKPASGKFRRVNAFKDRTSTGSSSDGGPTKDRNTKKQTIPQSPNECLLGADESKGARAESASNEGARQAVDAAICSNVVREQMKDPAFGAQNDREENDTKINLSETGSTPTIMHPSADAGFDGGSPKILAVPADTHTADRSEGDNADKNKGQPDAVPSVKRQVVKSDDADQPDAVPILSAELKRQVVKGDDADQLDAVPILSAELKRQAVKGDDPGQPDAVPILSAELKRQVVKDCGYNPEPEEIFKPVAVEVALETPEPCPGVPCGAMSFDFDPTSRIESWPFAGDVGQPSIPEESPSLPSEYDVRTSALWKNQTSPSSIVQKTKEEAQLKSQRKEAAKIERDALLAKLKVDSREKEPL